LKGWTTPQIVLFLEKCMVLSPESKMPVTVLDKMDSLYSLTASRNSEVRQSVQCAANNHASCTLCQPCTMHPLPTMHHAPSANHASCTLCQPCIMHPSANRILTVYLSPPDPLPMADALHPCWSRGDLATCRHFPQGAGPHEVYSAAIP
jgi:hypothetical protein